MESSGGMDGVLWKRRARKKDGGTQRETARQQGLVLSFYGHYKLRRRREEAASGVSEDRERGRRSGLVKREEGLNEDGKCNYYKVRREGL